MFCLYGILNAQQWETFDTSNSDLPSNNIKSIEVDVNGLKWIGTDEGLVVFDGTNWLIYTTQDQIADNSINDIATISNPNIKTEIWVATPNGLSSFNGNSIDSLFINPPLRANNSSLISDNVLAVAIDTGRIKWFGTDNGLSVFSGIVWENYTSFDLLTNNIILSIFSKNDGWNYLATKGGGVNRLRYDDIDGVTGASSITKEWSGIPSDTVFCVFIDSEGYEWFGTRHGASRHEGIDVKQNWITYTIDDGLINNNVISIVEDAEGAKWFGTTQGLSRLLQNQWQSWTTENGIAGDSINDISRDLDETLWFATNNGLSHFTPPTVDIRGQEVYPNYADIDVNIYPNPFNLQTRIEFSLPTADYVSIRIYNIRGQLVNNLFEAGLPQGKYEVAWNGNDAYYTTVNSGIYIAIIRGRNFRVSNKLVLLK